MSTMRLMRVSGTTALLAAALVVAGCGTVGDILGGGGDPYPDGGSAADLRGTVDRVDTSDRVIWVESEDGVRYGLRNEGDLVALGYDDRTVVEFQGRTYRPADLERGDRIAAEVEGSGGNLHADRIEVLSDVSTGGGGTWDDDRLANNVRGVVRDVDTYERTLTLEQADVRHGFTTGTGSGDVVEVEWDADTVVEYEGRRYTPDNLERGDLVEVVVRDLGGRLLAEQIEVVTDVRDRTSSY